MNNHNLFYKIKWGKLSKRYQENSTDPAKAWDRTSQSGVKYANHWPIHVNFFKGKHANASQYWVQFAKQEN